MLRVVRPNTYKTPMPRLSSEFYDFEGAEDEAAAGLLARHIVSLVHRARKTKLLTFTTNQPQNSNSAQAGSGAQWLSKLLPGAKTSVPVFLPEDFVPRVVRDVVRMTEGEAQGIRGCMLCLEMWDGNRRVGLGKIRCDPKVVSTYTLYVRMVRAAPPAYLSGLRFLSNTTNEAIYISPGYQLEKIRHSLHT
ncbi:protein scylla-like [Panulirus ornatus]|uniref:protein scylla-like n=1 Tax=Panulirus ornatus TaxID=150431 RepID=UPI003A880F72